MKNKKGKKLVVLGAMAALLTLIGVSGSQTYAKYVESTTVDGESATVAKWGYVANVTGDLFGQKYVKDGSTTFSKIDEDASTGLTISASGSTDMVAPGSKGSMTIRIDGSSEVLTSLSFDGLDNIKDVCLSDGTNNYYPLKWSISGQIDNGETNEALNLSNKKLSECLALFKDKSYTVNPNNELDVDITLSWEWAYEVQDDPGTVEDESKTSVLNLMTDTPADVLSVDQADTFLGILNSDEDGKGLSGYDYETLRTKYSASETLVGFDDLEVTLTQVQEA